VRVLAGGFAAWRAAGLAEARGAAPAPAPGDFRATPAGDGGFATVDAQSLWSSLRAGTAVAIDARAPERYAGITEPLDPVAGHIPGARNLPYAALLTPQGTLLPADRLRERIGTVLAGKPAASAVLYCGSGVTACALHLATAGLAGPDGPAIYPGSWSEWCRDATRPVAVGMEP
jgi:thiosulfate/3-mercaptopyruvate sulfurtransferase